MVKTTHLLGKLPEPLGDMPGLVMDNRFLVFGGGSGQEVRDAILQVDSQKGTCTRVGQMPYASRGHQVVAIEGNIYLLGGFDEGTRDDLWRLDLKTGANERLKPMPKSNAWFAVTTYKNTIVIVGGFTIPEGYLGHIYIYDPQTDDWTMHERALDAPPFTRGKIGSNVVVSYGDHLISCGGADEWDNQKGRANALGLTGRYDMAHKTWSALPQQIHPREGLVAAQYGDVAYLVGGMSEDADAASALIEAINLSSGEVRQVAQLSTGRLTPAVGIVHKRLIVAGGVTQPIFDMSDTIEYLDL